MSTLAMVRSDHGYRRRTGGFMRGEELVTTW